MKKDYIYESGKEAIERAIEAQEAKERAIAPEQLPFDLTAELGTVVEAEEVSPGVYSISARKAPNQYSSEYYVVTKEAPAISDQARTYGREFVGKPGLHVYECDTIKSGRLIISFEVLRYQQKHHLPVIERQDSLYSTAIYGMEQHPEYFGPFPVPAVTPRGYTVKHRTIINGVYWLETDRCEEMLAVCYPIWQSDITIPEQSRGEQLEYDRVRGIDNTLGYLFFTNESCCIPLYELCLVHPEIEEAGVIDKPALLNAICKFYPEYAGFCNVEEIKHRCENFYC